ncbi:hypothetical protein [Streptomyces microflavus]
MPALAPDSVPTLTEIPADLADDLREGPDPKKPQQEHTDIPRAAESDLPTTEFRTDAREMSAPHTLHYDEEDLRTRYGGSAASEPGCCWCR